MGLEEGGGEGGGGATGERAFAEEFYEGLACVGGEEAGGGVHGFCGGEGSVEEEIFGGAVRCEAGGVWNRSWSSRDL